MLKEITLKEQRMNGLGMSKGQRPRVTMWAGGVQMSMLLNISKDHIPLIPNSAPTATHGADRSALSLPRSYTSNIPSRYSGPFGKCCGRMGVFFSTWGIVTLGVVDSGKRVAHRKAMSQGSLYQPAQGTKANVQPASNQKTYAEFPGGSH